MTRNKAKILIIGTLPPPIGGVTIHLKRLLAHMEIRNLNNRATFYDYKKESCLYGLNKILNADFIHIHLSNKWARFIMILIGRVLQKKIIITFHGKYCFENLLDRWSLQISDISCVLNDFTYNKAKSLANVGVNVQKISAFIPPLKNEGVLSDKAKIKISELRKEYDQIFCTNAHHFVLDQSGRDLYGIDLILKCMIEIPHKGLIVADPSGELYNRYSCFSNYANIIFLSRPEPFFEILKLCSGFIRATTTDGDSLSVKESIYYGTPVIASDCVDRPKPCLLFEVNNKECLKEKLIQKIGKINDRDVNNGADDIVQIYQSL